MPYAIEYDGLGGPEVLEYREVERAVPGTGQVVVDVRAVGVNPIELKLRSGARASRPFTGPRRIGTDAAGVITAIGDGVDGWAIGDEVIVSGASSAYATETLARAAEARAEARRPRLGGGRVDPDPGRDRAPGAHLARRRRGRHAPPPRRIRRRRAGRRSSSRAGSARSSSRRRASPTTTELRELGAIPVTYGPGLADRVRDAAPQGVDVALDGAGTDEAIEVSKQLVADPERIGTIVLGWRAAELGIRAWSGGNPIPLTPEESQLRLDAVPLAATLAASGGSRSRSRARYPLTEAAEAHRQSESGQRARQDRAHPVVGAPAAASAAVVGAWSELPLPRAVRWPPWRSVEAARPRTHAGASAGWRASSTTSPTSSGPRSRRPGTAAPTAARPTGRCSATACCRSRAAGATRSTTSRRPAGRATRASATTRSPGGCGASGSTSARSCCATARSGWRWRRGSPTSVPGDEPRRRLARRRASPPLTRARAGTPPTRARERRGDLGGRTLRALHLERVVRLLDPLERRGRPDAGDDLVELLVRRRERVVACPAGTASAR